MRWMLLVDTCGEGGGVAVARLPLPGSGEAPVIVAECDLPGRETQERLMSCISQILAQSSLEPETLDVLTVITGPGSFTGVRIGIAAVKGLAEALGIPVVGVSRLAVLAAQANSSASVQAWIDAGRGDVFVGHFGGVKPTMEMMLHGSDAAGKVKPGEQVIVMEDRLMDSYPRARRVSVVGVREAMPLAAAAALRHDFSDHALLDANYLRVPDAELARLVAALPASG